MSEKRLGKQLLIWALMLIALLVVLWGYKQSWWKREGNLLEVNQEKIEQTKEDIDKLMDEFGYWGYRINLVNAKSDTLKGEAAYRYMNDKYELMVVAELPALADGYNYEGWLAVPATESRLNIGKLVKQIDGRYILYFTSNNNYSNFYQMIISKESSDGKTEPSIEYVLTGNFR